MHVVFSMKKKTLKGQMAPLVQFEEVSKIVLDLRKVILSFYYLMTW